MSVRPSVCMSVCLSGLGKTWFSRPLIEISFQFFLQIPLINEHLFCKYFVRLSVGNATKALLLMDVLILFFKVFSGNVPLFFLAVFFLPFSPKQKVIQTLFFWDNLLIRLSFSSIHLIFKAIYKHPSVINYKLAHNV